MRELLREACRQTEQAIGEALGRTCPVRSRLSQRGTIANAAPKALRLDGEELASRLSLEGTWLESVSCENGFLNFTLREEWMRAAAERPPAEQPLPPLPAVPVSFPARIHREDWFFAGKKASPTLCARQDQENPGWLVRVTEERLHGLEARAVCREDWTEEEKALLLRLAALDEGMSRGRLRDELTTLARLIWRIGPHRMDPRLNLCCQRVLHNGRAVVIRNQK